MVFNPLTILHASQEDPVFVVKYERSRIKTYSFSTVTNAEEVEFDRILGALEDILVGNCDKTHRLSFNLMS